VEAVNQFNQLRAYALSGVEIVQWAATIERLVPDLDPVALCWLIDQMLQGEYAYDRHAGVQQLIMGLRNVERTEVGNYKFKIEFPG
jgi:hypothetical protein